MTVDEAFAKVQSDAPDISDVSTKIFKSSHAMKLMTATVKRVFNSLQDPAETLSPEAVVAAALLLMAAVAYTAGGHAARKQKVQTYDPQ